MPSSTPKVLTPICEAILSLQPIHSALDIGVGMGKMGALIREYCEIYINWRFYQEEWKVLIHGIEIHEKYKNPMYQMYSEIFYGDATKVIDNLPYKYDLITMLDVIEHIEKREALKLLSKMRQKGKHVIVSYCNNDQGPARDNPHEAHISKWNVADFNPKKILAKEDSIGWALLLV